MKIADRNKTDPRLEMSDFDLLDARSYQALPMVAEPRRATDGLGLAAGLVGVLAIGAITFVSLSNHRIAPSPHSVVAIAPTPREQVTEEPASQLETIAPASASEESVAPAEAAQSQAVPMVLDNTATAQSAAPETREANATTAGAHESAEAFALNSNAQGGAARAMPPGNMSATILEGTIIPAVLETAVNTDIPGNSRAIVSRDVRSFDGSTVLIPRGSRLIGQYRTAAAGQSRALISWSRLVRPDGVSVDLSSPAVDTNGAAGIAGQVDRHFLQNFGSALLYSFVGALPALANAASPTIVIGTNSAQSAGGQMTQADARAAPTIRVPIGTPIQVFTNRDLAFD